MWDPPRPGLEPCPLHWQADSQPLRHQGSPWRVFIISGCWLLSKAFSASIHMIIWFLFFNLLMWCVTLIDLHVLESPCIPQINPTWSWYMILLMYFWIWFASILWRIFGVYVHQRHGPAIFFFGVIFGFSIMVMVPSLNDFGSFLPLQIFGIISEA